MRKPSAIALACLAFPAFLGGSAAAEDPPPLPNISATGVLAAEVQQMKARIDFWVNMTRSAGSDANVLYARDRFVEDYDKMNEKEAGYVFAGQAAAAAEPLLRTGFGADAMARIKEVNLAIALAQMPQASIQPALEAMVNCGRNPAVRYFGWKGYREARTRILGQGLSPTQKATASIQKAARNETSALVLGQLFWMTDMEAARPRAVSKDVWDLAVKQALAALSDNWRDWCLRVMSPEADANEPMAEACLRAVWAARSHAEWVGQDRQQKTLILQMLVDMAYAAARGFAHACSAGTPTDDYADLLTACEEALNAVTKAGKQFIRKPLSNPKVASMPYILLFWVDPETKQNCGVETWADFLKDQGVVSPKPRLEAPATASAPAGGQATAPK